MKFKFKIFLLAAVFFLSNFQNVFANVEISDERADANYWISRIKDGDKIFMNAEEISNFNSKIREKDDYSKNLSEQSEIILNAELREKIQKLTDDANLQGTPEVLANRNLESLRDIDIAVRYGVTVERGNIRLLPQNLSGDKYDALQGTAIDPAEPVAILHESKDGKFFFVQAKNFFGWINKMNVAMTDKKIWLEYVNRKNFLVVISNKKIVELYGKKLLFQMGSKIPLIKEENNFYVAKLPINQDGYLQEIQLNIDKDETLSKNFLPCTPNNFITQAFKFLGDEYGWHGLNDGVDDSSFVQNIYKSFGLEIPRENKKQVGVMPIFAIFNNVTNEEKISIIRRAPTSSLIFTPENVMMKLGNDAANTPVVIQALSSYFENGKKIYIRKVIVSELNFKIFENSTAFDNLTDIIFIKPE